MMAYRHGVVREWLQGKPCIDVGAGRFPVSTEARGMDLQDGFDARRLPLGDHSVEVLTCLEVLEHVREPDEALREFRRVLKKGGTLIVSTPWVTPYWKLFVWPLWERTFGRRWLHEHINEYDGKQLRGAVERAGFTVEDHVMVGFCDQLIRARSP
jgi:ubiquinone/menaquinone biosynthesis C-methylase UbiE